MKLKTNKTLTKRPREKKSEIKRIRTELQKIYEKL
jgi:hypothetical protein